MTKDNHIKGILKDLPSKPGVYQYYDEKGSILYVGKAKSLRARVRSYFNGEHVGKTRVLVKKIVDIKFIIVPTEQDALLLENNLIKKYRPPYNIQLKDDKTYPWICVKKERFPRVYRTRRVVKDGSTYFGPYASVRLMDTLLDLIHNLFPLRNCNYALTKENIEAEKFKVCLEYHIGNCKGACIGEELEENYNEKIDQIKSILRGNINQVTKHLKGLMKEYASNLDFEAAQEVKSKLEILEGFQSKSTVVSPTINNVDVFSLFESDQGNFINFFKVVNGAIIQGHTVEVKNKLDETKEELLENAIVDFRERFGSNAKEVIAPYPIDLPLEGVKVHVPQRGDKLHLLELSIRNAKFFGLERKKAMVSSNNQSNELRILEKLKSDLNLTELPVHIECFDNSNIQGAFPVGACVVFKNGKPSKKDYRIFNIKTVEGPNDFASMEEVLTRRYKRMLEEGGNLPQLIIIDGGKGQLSSAVVALKKVGAYGNLAVIGIAKKLEEIFFPGDSYPLYIDKRSESLKLIQHLRNEAHRFGITKHRNRRSKGMVVSELDNIDGIGPKTKETLLKHFKSVKKIREASLSDLENLLGKSKATIIFDYFSRVS